MHECNTVLVAEAVMGLLHSMQMDLRIVKECLARNRRRAPLAENVAHSSRQQMQ